MLDDTLLNATKQARADCRANELPILWGAGIFKMSHTLGYIKYDRKPTERKNRISHADRKVWNFENKAFLKNIVMLCLLKLHRLVILFSSPASVFRPSQLTSKTKCTTLPPPPFTNSVWHQLSMEVGGGESASASTVGIALNIDSTSTQF